MKSVCGDTQLDPHKLKEQLEAGGIKTEVVDTLDDQYYFEFMRRCDEQKKFGPSHNPLRG